MQSEAPSPQPENDFDPELGDLRGDSAAEAQAMTDSQWRRLFMALYRDINDRRGLKFEWRAARENGAMREQIYPAWRKIIESQLDREGTA